MSDLVMALNTLNEQITTVLTALNPPLPGVSGSVFRGWPTSTELAKVIASNKGATQITLWPLKGRSDARYNPFDYPMNLVTPVAQLAAHINPSNPAQLIVTVGPEVGDLIHCFHGQSFFKTYDANYGPAIGNETPVEIATIIAASVNALKLPGITCQQNGSIATLTGTLWQYVNIGGSTTMTMEVAREERIVQCTVWAPDAVSRETVGNAIIANVGGTDVPRLVMPDGNILYVLYENDRWWDKAESSYSTYRWDIFFQFEYPITRATPVNQLEAFTVSTGVNGTPQPIQHFGEP